MAGLQALCYPKHSVPTSLGLTWTGKDPRLEAALEIILSSPFLELRRLPSTISRWALNVSRD